MPSVTDSPSLLSGLALGDIAFLPGLPPSSVRLLVSGGLGQPVSAFAVLGEMTCVVAECSTSPGSLEVFSPVELFPPNLSSAKIIAEGAAAFWSAHLRAAQGGMGEAYFRIMLPPGQVDVVFLLYRGPEVVVFVRSGSADEDSWKIQAMPRPVDASTAAVSRFAAVVEPLGVPLPPLIPAPSRPEPATVPSRVR